LNKEKPHLDEETNELQDLIHGLADKNVPEKFGEDLSAQKELRKSEV
jgi:hypothetical protein